MCRSILVVALGIALCMLMPSNLRAADKSPPKKAQPAAKAPPAKKSSPAAAKKPEPSAAKQPHLRCGEAAIEAALATPTQIEFVNTPLVDVIDWLKGHHGIEIQLDSKALGDAGIGSDTPITKNVNGVSLRSALNLMLRELNLTWTIQDEVLLITSPEEAECSLTTKVYDVADLVVCRDSKGELWNDYDSLIRAIDSTIMPTTWDQVGGPGSIGPANFGTAKALIVRQTYAGHQKVAGLLERIREIAKKTPDAGLPRRDPRQIATLLNEVREIAKKTPDAGLQRRDPPSSESVKKQPAAACPSKDKSGH
jgi:hypothetical protein